MATFQKFTIADSSKPPKYVYVNIDFIQSLCPWGDGATQITLCHDDSFIVQENIDYVRLLISPIGDD